MPFPKLQKSETWCFQNFPLFTLLSHTLSKEVCKNSETLTAATNDEGNEQRFRKFQVRKEGADKTTTDMVSLDSTGQKLDAADFMLTLAYVKAATSSQRGWFRRGKHKKEKKGSSADAVPGRTKSRRHPQ